MVLALAAAGGFFGLLLAGFGFLAAGLGHGCYVLIGVSSSPIGLYGDVMIALIGTPVLWTGVGGLLALVRLRAWRTMLLILLLAHYVALIPILRDPLHFGDWSALPRVSGPTFTGFAIYAVGQLAILLPLISFLRRPKRLADIHLDNTDTKQAGLSS